MGNIISGESGEPKSQTQFLQARTVKLEAGLHRVPATVVNTNFDNGTPAALSDQTGGSRASGSLSTEDAALVVSKQCGT